MADKIQIEVVSASGDTVPDDSSFHLKEQERLQRLQMRIQSAKMAANADERANIRLQIALNKERDRVRDRSARDAEKERKAKEKILDDEAKTQKEIRKERLRAIKAEAAESNKQNVVRRRFINDMLGAVNNAHMGRRINHAIDSIQNIFKVRGSRGSGALQLAGDTSSVVNNTSNQSSTINTASGVIGASAEVGQLVGAGKSTGSAVGATTKGASSVAGTTGGAVAGAGAAGGSKLLAVLLNPVTLAIAAVVGGFYGLYKVTGMINDRFEKMGDNLAPFSGDVIGAQVENELAILNNDIRRGSQFGGELGELTREKGKQDVLYTNLGDALSTPFMPLIIQLEKLETRLLEVIVPGLNVGSALLEAILTPVVALLDVINGMITWLEETRNDFEAWLETLNPLFKSLVKWLREQRQSDGTLDDGQLAQEISAFMGLDSYKDDKFFQDNVKTKFEFNSFSN